MIIKVFLSSSLKLKQQRQAFIDAFKAEETDAVRFVVYAHESNGVMRIISGADSQEAINASALEHQAFIAYAGDRIGSATIDEFLNQVGNARVLFRFIYMLHQPGLDSDLMTGKGYVDWDTFYAAHMHDGNIKYYETELPRLSAEEPEKRVEESIANIRDKAAAIARELRDVTLPTLYPPMLSYDKVITAGQSSYRRALDFYFPREVDRTIADALAAPVPLTVISGTSLAGKTRAVTEALRAMPDDTHIHIVRFDSDAADVLRRINPHLQFGSSFRNILFIDDLHSLFDTSADAPMRVMDLCRFAAEHPGRLAVVATSIVSADDILSRLRPLATADPWLRQVRSIEIGPVSRAEAALLLRLLRRKGRFELKAGIHGTTGDIPLGSLFVDLDRMRNAYEDALRRDTMLYCVFDAIKTLWLWKQKSRDDIPALLDFINQAYAEELGTAMTRPELIALLRLIPEFVMLSGGFRPKMVIEEILVNDVFRFDVSGDIRSAVDRIIAYIAANEAPVKNFTKLAERLGRAGMTDNVVSRVCDIYPLHTLGSLSETEPSLVGDSPLDWGRFWQSAVARSLDRQNLHDELYSMLPADFAQAPDGRAHYVLDVIINRELRSAPASPTLQRILGADGMPGPQFVHTACIGLVSALLSALPFGDALRLFEAIDFDVLIRRNSHSTTEPEFIAYKTAATLSTAHNRLLARAASPADVKAVFAATGAQCARLDPKPFADEATAMFAFSYSSSWYAVSRNIGMNDATALFSLVLDVPIADGHPDSTRLLTSKAACLNALIAVMDEFDARDAWKRMGPLRDNFTLTALLKKLPDFTSARGYVDEYLGSDSGSDATLSLTPLNALLMTCRTRSDIAECRQLYIKYGIIADGSTLADVNDNYTIGILISMPLLSFDEKRDIMRHRRDPSRIRDARTLGSLVYAAPDFASAYALMFSDRCAEFTPEEQELLRLSPLAVSWLCWKTGSDDEARTMWAMLDDLRQRELAGEFLEPIFCHPDANVLSEVVKNSYLCPTPADAEAFLASVRADFPQLPFNLIPLCNIAERRLIDEAPQPSDATLAMVNSLIADYPDAPMEIRRRMVKNRFYCRPATPRDSPFPDRPGLYPMVDDNGTYTLRHTGSFDFAMNTLANGTLHVYMLPDLISHIAEHTPEPATVLARVIAAARKWRITIGQVAYSRLRDKLRRRGIITDLLPIAYNYSIIKELTMRLHRTLKNARPISVDEAFAAIREYERTTGSQIYLSQRFMDAVVKCMSEERGVQFPQMLQRIRDLKPAHFVFNSYCIYFLAHLVRNTDDLQTLRSLMDGRPIDDELYQALTAALNKCSEKNRIEIANGLVPEIEETLRAGLYLSSSAVSAILKHSRSFTLDGALEFLDRHNIPVRGSIHDLRHLANLIRDWDDYDRVMGLAHADITEKELAAVLPAIAFAMYDVATRRVRPDVLDAFDCNEAVDRWHSLARHDAKGILHNTISKIYQAIEDPDTAEATRFFNLWEDVGGFRL